MIRITSATFYLFCSTAAAADAVFHPSIHTSTTNIIAIIRCKFFLLILQVNFVIFFTIRLMFVLLFLMFFFKSVDHTNTIFVVIYRENREKKEKGRQKKTTTTTYRPKKLFLNIRFTINASVFLNLYSYYTFLRNSSTKF